MPKYEEGDRVEFLTTEDYEDYDPEIHDEVEGPHANLPTSLHKQLTEPKVILRVEDRDDYIRYYVDFDGGEDYVCDWNIKGLCRLSIKDLYE